MPVLNSTQRSSLEKAVIKARRLSVRGAYNSLKAFAVDHKEPYSHMNAGERELRNQLRSKARLMGDHTTADGGHTIDKLAYELAYESWHQMLFAKFLEANSLLMHPEHGISVSLEECEELSQEEGFNNKWQAAAHYASKMLPAIFRQDDPLMHLKYSTNDRLALEELIEGIAEDVFKADDSLGWVYQYWQTEEKARINAEGNPIDGDSISAVTQLFTEPYMVHFLIDNTLGAWWTARNPGVTSPYEFKYLRTLDDGTPAAGSFEGWPESIAEITMLDPCMGSGHFVVDVFMAMAQLRMHDEGLTKAEACDAVIRDNIHGLEIDPRCTQIAAFNLALTAWKFCGEYKVLPEMNLACCGIAPTGKKEEWLKLANTEQDTEKRNRLKGGLERMYNLFQQAPELGSLIDPTIIKKDAFTSDFEELQPFLEEALNTEGGEKINERAVIAAGVAKSGSLLARKYVWQITNVPYLLKGKQSDVLSKFCSKYYKEASNDLATVFLERMIRNLLNKGTVNVVIPQNWLFLTRYISFRKKLLKSYSINLICKLGAKAFSTPMWDFNVMLFSCNKNVVTNDTNYVGIDVGKFDSFVEKSKEICSAKIQVVSQINQLNNPDIRILFEDLGNSKLMSDLVDTASGQSSFDRPRFYSYFWTLPHLNNDWKLSQSTTPKTVLGYDGLSEIIFWEDGDGKLKAEMERLKADGYTSGIWKAGVQIWGSKGIAVSLMGRELKSQIYVGEAYDQNVAVLKPNEDSTLLSLAAFVDSGEFSKEVRKIDDKINVTSATLNKVPFDLEHWQKVAEEIYPNGLPKPYSDDPTQWLFHGHPLHTESPLQVTIARLSGYEWPAENDEGMELSDEAKEKIKAIKALNLPFDEDGIVCIPAVNGEVSAADRIRENIMSIWGGEYNGSTLSNLLEQEGSKKRDLESYLRDEYFSNHCKLFKNRPFVWHIWDGRKDGFSALVNYHKLDKATLEKLIYTYLGDWINQCDLKMQNNVSGADGLLSAAKALKEKLELILKGEPPYDIFVRWKSLAEQPIGWEPYINDGVRMNVYPFIQAGVLRKKFNVKWGKDRGKNPSGSHWGPDRWNRYEDLNDEFKLKDDTKNIIPHLANEIKRKARKKDA